MSDQHLLQANIWKLQLLRAMQGAILFLPIIVIFWQNNGLNLQEVFLLQTAFSICMIATEIPSGYMSDRFGRKNTLVCAGFTSILAIILYSLGRGFWGFFWAELMFAFSWSLYSGTIEAMTYDTLLVVSKIDDYRKTIGHQSFLRFITESAGSVLGGFVAIYSLRASVWLTLIPFSVAFLTSLTLVEPERHKLQEERHLQVLWNICKQSMVHNKLIRNIIVLNAIIAGLGYMLFWLTQPFQELMHMPLAWFGIMHAVIVGAGALATKYTHLLAKWYDDRKLLIGISIVMTGSYFCIGYTMQLWSLAFFVLARIAWGALNPVISDMLNKMTTSDMRATVLSLRSLFFRIIFSITGPLIGYTADIFTLQTAILMMGTMSGVSIVVMFWIMRGMWEKMPQ